MQRYDMVLHLVTAADGAEEHFVAQDVPTQSIKSSSSSLSSLAAASQSGSGDAALAVPSAGGVAASPRLCQSGGADADGHGDNRASDDLGALAAAAHADADGGFDEVGDDAMCGGVDEDALRTARALDARVRAAWAAHPRRIVVDNSTNFDSKLDRAFAHVAAMLDPRGLSALGGESSSFPLSFGARLTSFWRSSSVFIVCLMMPPSHLQAQPRRPRRHHSTAVGAQRTTTVSATPLRWLPDDGKRTVAARPSLTWLWSFDNSLSRSSCRACALSLPLFLPFSSCRSLVARHDRRHRRRPIKFDIRLLSITNPPTLARAVASNLARGDCNHAVRFLLHVPPQSLLTVMHVCSENTHVPAITLAWPRGYMVVSVVVGLWRLLGVKAATLTPSRRHMQPNLAIFRFTWRI